MMELRECPYCGGKAITQTDSLHYGPEITIGCEKQGCHGCIGDCEPYSNEKDAIAAWNTRHDDWQDISLCPMDGTHVLLYRPDMQFVGYYATRAKCWVYNAPGLPVVKTLPTHFRHLPKAPGDGR